MLEDLDNQSLLVLYHAGELPEEERARVDRLLRTDAALRAELEKLDAAHAVVVRTLAGLDAREGIPESQLSAATRQTVRAMRQWQVDQTVRNTRTKRAPRRWRMDWRTYTAACAAAAVLFIGLFVWLGPTTTRLNGLESPAVAQADPDDVDAYALAVEQSMLPPSARTPNDEMDQAEHAMSRLKDLTDLSRGGNLQSELQ